MLFHGVHEKQLKLVKKKRTDEQETNERQNSQQPGPKKTAVTTNVLNNMLSMIRFRHQTKRGVDSSDVDVNEYVFGVMNKNNVVYSNQVRKCYRTSLSTNS